MSELLKSQLHQLTVLESELNSLRSSAKVYKQQQNSNVYFLDDQTRVKEDVKKRIQELKQKARDVEVESKIK